MRNQPNLLFLLSDEHRRYCMGFVENGDAVHTPHFDAFAEQSAVFNNAIVEIPVCCPSRATLITGKYGMNHGQHRLRQPMLKDADKHTIFTVLRDAGYHIGYIGKWHITTHAHLEWHRQMLEQDPEFFTRVHEGSHGIK